MRRVRMGLAVMTVAALVAACGSDDDSSSATDSAAPAPSSNSPDTTEPTTTQPPTTEPEATPDTEPETTQPSGPASGDPVQIGFVVMDLGPLAQPAITDAADAAVAYVNENLGGISGRPLELVPCSTDGSPESSAKCGNDFVAAGVPMVLQGIDLTNAALHPILESAGIPLIGQQPVTAADYVQGVFFGGANVAYTMGAATYMRDVLKPSKIVVMAYSSASTTENLDNLILPALEQTGAEVEVIRVDPGSPDLSVPVAAALALSPDLIYTFFQDVDCTKMITSARQLGYDGDVFMGSCSGFAAAAPGESDGVYTLNDLYLADDLSMAPDNVVEEVAIYTDTMAELAPDRPLTLFTGMTFAGVMNVHQLLNRIGADEITSESILTELDNSVDVHGFMGGPYTCGGVVAPEWPTVCGGNVLVFQAEGGAFKQVTEDFIFGPDIMTD